MQDNNQIFKMMQLMQQENGMAELLQQPRFALGEREEPHVSVAEIMADIINLARLDVMKMAEAQGIEMDVRRMRPEQAALLIQGMVKGDSLRLVDVFNGIEERREAVLGEMLEDDEYERWMKVKEQQIWSAGDCTYEAVDEEAKQIIEDVRNQSPPGSADAPPSVSPAVGDAESADTDEEQDESDAVDEEEVGE